jgi:hypothetical protein
MTSGILPKTIYHYCSTEAWVGIINNCELWASDFRFMNDTRDFKHGVGIFTQAVSKVLRESGHGVKRLADQILALLESDSVCVYIASFSEGSDDNSQWSRYARENGVALGFNRERLERLLQDVFFDFGRVEYDHSRQAAQFEDFVRRSLLMYDGASLSSEDLERITKTQLCNLAAGLSMCKDASFVAEKEWRASAFTLAGASREKFRATSQGLIPYIAIPLIDSAAHSLDGLFDEIIVGPGRFRDENTAAAKRFIKSKRISCEIVRSASTLRF